MAFSEGFLQLGTTQSGLGPPTSFMKPRKYPTDLSIGQSYGGIIFQPRCHSPQVILGLCQVRKTNHHTLPQKNKIKKLQWMKCSHFYYFIFSASKKCISRPILQAVGGTLAHTFPASQGTAVFSLPIIAAGPKSSFLP